MNYLYHLVREDMKGVILYPLNVLKEKYPDIYASYAKKYTGREEIMQQKIPRLDCLWNDVIHFTAVSPHDLKQALVEAGQPEKYSLSFYQIDPDLLEPEKTIVYLNAQTRKENSMNENNFVSYDPTHIENYSILPERTKAYYKDMYQNEKKLPLVHKWVPHILYKGNIDVSQLPIITV